MTTVPGPGSGEDSSLQSSEWHPQCVTEERNVGGCPRPPQTPLQLAWSRAHYSTANARTAAKGGLCAYRRRPAGQPVSLEPPVCCWNTSMVSSSSISSWQGRRDGHRDREKLLVFSRSQEQKLPDETHLPTALAPRWRARAVARLLWGRHSWSRQGGEAASGIPSALLARQASPHRAHERTFKANFSGQKTESH